MKYRRSQFITLISVLLVAGFAATSVVSYLVANHSLQSHIRSNTLPLTSDNIYSEIQRDILPTVVISSLMAQDTFVRDWVVDGEQDSSQIIRYLATIQQRYGTTTAFFVSEQTRNYYHPSGILKQVAEDNPGDGWYFRVRAMNEAFEINVDMDTADSSRTSFFVNHRVYDFKGDYIGAIGVGLSSQLLSDMIASYQQRFGREIYFIDQRGTVMMKSGEFELPPTIQQTEGLAELSDRILASDSGDYRYYRNGQDVLLNVRFVPELKWYVMVQQIDRVEEDIANTLWLNLAFSLVITLVVLALVSLTIRKYQRQLERMATRDKLTGLDNRYVIENNTDLALRNADRRGEPLTVVLVDIDHFKQINDQYGHLFGDQVIASVARQLRARLRESDLIGRWGGEEFLLLLPGCDLQQAMQLCETLRRQIAEQGVTVGDNRVRVTISLGLAGYQQGEEADTLFHRADQALYRAKAAGRNRTES